MKTKISRRVVTLLSAFALLNSAFSQTAPTIAGAGQPGEPLGGQPLLICLTSGGADQSSAKADVAVKDKAAASNDSGKNINMMYPTDNTYWTKLKEFVDYEPISAIDPELRGVLASIGIVKGQPFQPNAKQQELLKKAVETAPKMILAQRQLGRPDGRQLYYKDRQYENIWAGGTAEWLQESYIDPTQRAAYFQVAYASAPAMVMRTLDAGSKYPFTVRDADGDFLDGSKTYKLHLPKDPPAALFWAVTAYNITDGTMTQAPQLMPSINGMNNVQLNPDGFINLYFSPTKPPSVSESNWIQTVKGRAVLIAVRLYGTGVEFFDQTWKPDDVVKVK